MEVIDNPALTRLMLDHLADLYKIKQRREGIHLSTLIYCLTRSFFDNIGDRVEPTDEEVMLFSLGFGLQDVLTPSQAEVPVYERDGITFSPDFMLQIPTSSLPVPYTAETSVTYVELKTTRMSSGKEAFPETWLDYIMGGCFMREVNTYELSVLYMLGNYRPPFPVIKSFHLSFTDDELFDNWSYLMERKAVYVEATEKQQPPSPRQYNKDWECARCRYKLQCDAMILLKEDS